MSSKDISRQGTSCRIVETTSTPCCSSSVGSISVCSFVFSNIVIWAHAISASSTRSSHVVGWVLPDLKSSKRESCIQQGMAASLDVGESWPLTWTVVTKNSLIVCIGKQRFDFIHPLQETNPLLGIFFDGKSEVGRLFRVGLPFLLQLGLLQEQQRLFLLLVSDLRLKYEALNKMASSNKP